MPVWIETPNVGSGLVHSRAICTTPGIFANRQTAPTSTSSAQVPSTSVYPSTIRYGRGLLNQAARRQRASGSLVVPVVAAIGSSVAPRYFVAQLVGASVTAL